MKSSEVPAWLTTGAPTMMPSKSHGNRCASISPWRPPVEQPM
jgi:hypothetical protein